MWYGQPEIKEAAPTTIIIETNNPQNRAEHTKYINYPREKDRNNGGEYGLKDPIELSCGGRTPSEVFLQALRKAFLSTLCTE